MSTALLVLMAVALGLAASIPITILPPRYSGWSFLPTLAACVVGSLLGGVSAAFFNWFRAGAYGLGMAAMALGASAVGLVWHRYIRPRTQLLRH